MTLLQRGVDPARADGVDDADRRPTVSLAETG